MKFKMLVLVMFTLMLVSSGISAQTIDTIQPGDQVLVNLPTANAATAFTFANAAAGDFALSVVYLGAPFGVQAEWYDAAGTLLHTTLLAETSTGQAVSLPAEALTLLLTVESGTGGRALLTLNAAGASQTPPVTTETAELFPLSGSWTLNLIDYANNCPDDLTMADVWMPQADTNYTLTFSTLEQLPLEVHQLVAAQEIRETPEFFTVEPGAVPTTFTIIPNIQTAPYSYQYTVTSPESIELNYTQTLALSDCVLEIAYELLWFGEAEATSAAATGAVVEADLSLWSVFDLGEGVQDVAYVTDDPTAPNGALCARDVPGGSTWYYQADESFLDAIRAGYGLALSYDLRVEQAGTIYPAPDIELVIGNGFVLHYDLFETPGSDFTTITLDLRENAGWYDPDGAMPTDDAELFRQMLSDVTALLLRGEFLEGPDAGCLTNVRLIAVE